MADQTKLHNQLAGELATRIGENVDPGARQNSCGHLV